MSREGYVARLKRELRSFTRKSSGLPDYDEYVFSLPELLLATGEGMLILALFSYVFYRSALAFVWMLPALFPFLIYVRKGKVKKRKEQLRNEFREMMIAVIASLQAGYSIENAFMRAYGDMQLLYGKGSLITPELEHMNRALRNNRNMEDLLLEFSRRAKIPEVTDFAEVFRIAKRSGGDLPGVLQNTADLIGQKIEVKRQIATRISAKKMEQNIMNCVPFGIILYIDATTPGFFDSLYGNVTGVALMSVLLAVYVAAYLMAQRILNIDEEKKIVGKETG